MGLAELISPCERGSLAGRCLLCPTLVALSQIFIQKTIRKMVCHGKILNIDYSSEREGKNKLILCFFPFGTLSCEKTVLKAPLKGFIEKRLKIRNLSLLGLSVGLLRTLLDEGHAWKLRWETKLKTGCGLESQTEI